MDIKKSFSSLTDVQNRGIYYFKPERESLPWFVPRTWLRLLAVLTFRRMKVSNKINPLHHSFSSGMRIPFVPTRGNSGGSQSGFRP